MNDRINRRSFLGRGAAAAAGLAATGAMGGLGGIGGVLLGGEAGGATASFGVTNGPGRNGTSTAKPKRGGSLIFGTDAEAQGFNPTTAEWDENGYLYALTVFDPLMAVTTSGKVVPYLAESLKANSDYTSWTITLRPDVVFHDGTPCDGAALLANLDKQRSSVLTGDVFSQFIKDAVQTGDLSVRIDMTNPWASFPYTLSSNSQVGYVAAPSMLNAADGGTTHPIGTGPFVYKSWVQDSEFVATRNTKYWRKGYPYLDTITYKPIVDPTARSEALQSGTIDMMITFTPEVIVQYRHKNQWSYVDDSGKVVGEPQVECIQLNCAKAPFDDKNARTAMAQSFDTAQFNRVIGLGVSTPVTSPFVPGTPYYRKTTYPSYDLNAAKKSVKAYESTHHQPLSFTLGYIPDPEVQRSAVYLQQRWQSAGMKVALSVIQQNELIDQAVEGDYQAVTWRQFGSVDPDLNYVFWSADTVNKTGISLNIARNDDPRIQQALTTGRQNATPSVRAKAYQSVGEYLAQDLPYIWLGRAVWAVIASPKVQNFNNPKAPNGSTLIGNENGVVIPTQIWVS